MCVSCKNKKIVTRKENLTNSRNGRYENGHRMEAMLIRTTKSKSDVCPS